MSGVCVTSTIGRLIELSIHTCARPDRSISGHRWLKSTTTASRRPSRFPARAGRKWHLSPPPTACGLFSTCLTDATSTSSLSVAVARSGFWTGPFPLRRRPGPCPISQATPFAPRAASDWPSHARSVSIPALRKLCWPWPAHCG
jgi:hypothetical protein